jgi:hypothetical protein
MAVDNTLGSFSPHQGRIYAVYVGYTDIRVGAFPGIPNPSDNTDIFLVTSDNGGLSWSSPVRVNSDFSPTDGYTESNGGGAPGVITGRVQFLPAVAVDQATGTLVVSWRDGRDDASRARSAVYVTASTDGGQSFKAGLRQPGAGRDRRHHAQ